MKRSLFIICLVLLLVPAGVSANGYINVTTSPPNAYIRLDGTLYGNTPFNLSATSGPHGLTLSLYPYTDYQTNVNIPENSSISFSYTFQSSAPTITSISPNNGYNVSSVSGVTISGTSFSTNPGSVYLTRSGETNITGSCNWASTSTITCSFPTTGRTAGTWNVVVTNPDGQSATLANGFTLKSNADTPTLTSISPSSGAENSVVSITSLAGTNFMSTSTMKLVNPYYNDINGNVTSVNAAGTVITGTFNLNNQVPATYQVCVYNTASTYICGLSFQVLSPGGTPGNSSVYFQSFPSGATVSWKNGTLIGTTTFTYNITPGTYTVVVQKSGYKDYVGTFVAIDGKRVSFYAPLTLVGDDTTQATVAGTTPVKTVTTIRKSTLKVPTTYPSATTPEASPVDPVMVIGAAGIGIGLMVLLRR